MIFVHSDSIVEWCFINKVFTNVLFTLYKATFDVIKVGDDMNYNFLKKADYLHWLKRGELWVTVVRTSTDCAEGIALILLAGDPGIPEEELNQNIWPSCFIWISRRKMQH